MKKGWYLVVMGVFLGFVITSCSRARMAFRTQKVEGYQSVAKNYRYSGGSHKADSDNYFSKKTRNKNDLAFNSSNKTENDLERSKVNSDVKEKNETLSSNNSVRWLGKITNTKVTPKSTDVKGNEQPLLASTDKNYFYWDNSSDFKKNEDKLFKTKDGALQSVSKNDGIETLSTMDVVSMRAMEGAAGSGSFSGGMLVIMVILCLFPLINLIPVYLHDGAVTLNFWLTLILDLTIIGGVIFALLVVLDVVDVS